MQRLRNLLQKIDGNSYKAYKSAQGTYDFDGYQLVIDHVQGDPFAAPSRICVCLPAAIHKIPPALWLRGDDAVRKVALEDFLSRRVAEVIKKTIKGNRGSGCSGEIAIACGGQQILPRNAVVLCKNHLEARLVLALPAKGRRVAGYHAIEMIFHELPSIVEQALKFTNLPIKALNKHLDCAEDQHVLRKALPEHNLVAFIANGSILPRDSGVSDLPLKNHAIAFQAPDSLQARITLPHAGVVKGLGIPVGVTLIVGGGFHGKSTVLRALERGPYNHIPGDGREKVVTAPNAVKVRAEDGRAIAAVNISPFIDRLPFNKDTVRFTTDNASGSTSQAANIIEAVETGSDLLLIDEDTSATNFMIRDERMRQLVSPEKEPITPLVARVRELYHRFGVSSVIVMGGSGDYFDVADTAIMLDAYRPKDVTAQVKDLARTQNALYASLPQPPSDFQRQHLRKPSPRSFETAGNQPKIDAKQIHSLRYGCIEIDLSFVEQLIDIAQTRSIGLMIRHYLQHYAHQSNTLIEGLQLTLQAVQDHGLDCLSPYRVGNLALPRLQELAAAINRMRNLQWQPTAQAEDFNA